MNKKYKTLADARLVAKPGDNIYLTPDGIIISKKLKIIKKKE